MLSGLKSDTFSTDKRNVAGSADFALPQATRSHSEEAMFPASSRPGLTFIRTQSTRVRYHTRWFHLNSPSPKISAWATFAAEQFDRRDANVNSGMKLRQVALDRSQRHLQDLRNGGFSPSARLLKCQGYGIARNTVRGHLKNLSSCKAGELIETQVDLVNARKLRLRPGV